MEWFMLSYIQACFLKRQKIQQNTTAELYHSTAEKSLMFKWPIFD